MLITILTLTNLSDSCRLVTQKEGAIPSGAETVVELAKEDLAERLGGDKEKITLVKVDSVDWSDTSLGCPQPGMMYAQVITPGYKILLSYAGQTYEYHSDEGEYVLFCESK